MNAGTDDHQLVEAYATESSETAFQALVKRHLDLVYATALRQLGDPALAEEVAQNVFIVLARKAPRLARLETLAGWLHRTTILEAKARIRAELRRRRREEKAGELMALESEGSSPFASLVPLIDEALLHLRENDRLALILRFLEGHSLREVGLALGVDEDAARKRVSRALDRVTEFFRERGFTIPAGTGAGAVLASGVTHAPASLAAGIVQAGLASGGATSGLNLIYFHFMASTKTQAVIACAVLAAIPLVLQRQAEARLTREQLELTRRIAAAESTVTDLETAAARTRDAARQSEADALSAKRRVDHVEAQLQGKAPPPAYRWNDHSLVMRVPKELLRQLPVSATANKRGELSEQIKEILQLAESESARVQEAIYRFLATYHEARASKMKPVPATERELQGHPADEVRVFEVGEVRAELRGAREAFFAELEAALGSPDRYQLFHRALRNWMPLEDQDYYGINSGMAVFSFAHRERFYRPSPGTGWIPWGINAYNNGISASMAVADIPDIYQKHLADWMAIARSQPSAP